MLECRVAMYVYYSDHEYVNMMQLCSTFFSGYFE